MPHLPLSPDAPSVPTPRIRRRIVVGAEGDADTGGPESPGRRTAQAQNLQQRTSPSTILRAALTFAPIRRAELSCKS